MKKIIGLLILLGSASALCRDRGVLLEDLTWQEAGKKLTADTVVVIPIGAAAKEHGPHLKLNNDWILAEYLKKRVLARSDVVIAPTVPYHFYPAFVEYPGSTTLRVETARDLVVDICRSLARFGPRRFYALNTGISTVRALEPASALLASEGIILRYTDLNKILGPVEKAVLKQEGGSHADEGETSMILYINPSAVNMARAVKDYRPDRGRLTRNPKGDGTYSPTGIWGDPTLASRAKGAKLVEATVTGILEDIEKLRRESQPLVLLGGTIVDTSDFGRSEDDITDSAVVIQGGKIVAAGPRNKIEIPAGAKVLDISGKFVIPGLNDAFATQNNQAHANAYLYMGVTSIVGLDEPGGRRGPLYLGAKPGPHVYRLESVSGYDENKPPAASTADLRKRGRRLSAQELRDQVDALSRTGFKVLLLHYALSPEQTKVVVQRARELGLSTIGELGFTPYSEAIRLGVQAFVHVSRYSLELAPPEMRTQVAGAPFGHPREKFYEYLAHIRSSDPSLKRYASVLGSARVGLIPTLSLEYLDLPDHENPWKEPVAAILDPKDINLPANPAIGKRDQAFENAAANFPAGLSESLFGIESEYCKAGAKYVAGSGTTAFGTMPGISLHTELKLLTRIGLSPRQALAAATVNFEELLGWKNVGRVKAGYNADLLVLDGNPAKNIANAKKISILIFNGEILDRQKLLVK
jgi:creatinine amidohydrolase